MEKHRAVMLEGEHFGGPLHRLLVEKRGRLGGGRGGPSCSSLLASDRCAGQAGLAGAERGRLIG